MNTVKNILIVDDSEMNRQILADILGVEYKYLYAADGQEAIEMLARGTDVDLMLLDINMPNMNGFKVLDIMERRCWLDEIPVIVISSESDTLFVRRAYNLGATDYIARPFDAAIVQRRVENILRLYTRQKDLVQMVETQVYEREKVSSTMTNFLSHVIE
ncbi:MAG: response regulator, partial [Eubacteriales bacterium]|nr:response regulator [Eubacteriales bacterium]